MRPSRFRTAALAAVVSILIDGTRGVHSAATLVDSTGILNKGLPTISPKGGVVALLTSPGTSGSVFPDANDVSVEDYGSEILITAPGASLEGVSSGLARGTGAAAAGSLAGAVILSGVTLADAEVGLANTRHGRTLAELFASRLRSGKQGGSALLIVAVQSDGSADEVDSEEIQKDIANIFDAVAAAAGVGGSLAELFDVDVVAVKSSSDSASVMSKASAAASRSSLSGSDNVATAFAALYNDISNAQTADPTPVAEAILACNDAYSRASRTSRTKIAMWKHRVSRGHVVDKFGSNAESLIQRTLDLFDRDTMAAAGLSGAGEQRLEMRSKLQDRIENNVRQLFGLQVSIIEKSTLKKFNNALLRKMGKDSAGKEFYDENAAALQTATLAFDSAVSNLEVPSMSLSKSKAMQDMTGKLTNALMTFPDSPAAKIKAMKNVEETVSKQKKPQEGSIDVTLDFVAMIRPDGFGSLQGFAGYQLGQHSVTVGVHNDADDPQVISGFGGVRPPFIRVQPKLKLDVEL